MCQCRESGSGRWSALIFDALKTLIPREEMEHNLQKLIGSLSLEISVKMQFIELGLSSILEGRRALPRGRKSTQRRF